MPIILYHDFFLQKALNLSDTRNKTVSNVGEKSRYLTTLSSPILITGSLPFVACSFPFIICRSPLTTGRSSLVVERSPTTGGRSIWPSSAPWPLWPRFLPGRWKPRWLELGRELSPPPALSELSPKRAKMLFLFGGGFISSFNPTSSNHSSSVGWGRSNWDEPLAKDRVGCVILESRLCRGKLESLRYTGERAEMSLNALDLVYASLGLRYSYKGSAIRFKWFAGNRERLVFAQHTSITWWCRRRCRPLPKALFLCWRRLPTRISNFPQKFRGRSCALGDKRHHSPLSPT